MESPHEPYFLEQSGILNEKVDSSELLSLQMDEITISLNYSLISIGKILQDANKMRISLKIGIIYIIIFVTYEKYSFSTQFLCH